MEKIKLYDSPRIGLFLVPKKDGLYILGSGWECEILECVIIGEDNLCYIEKIKCVINGYWIGKKVRKKIEQVVIGVNKSRLIEWKVTNCELLL